MKRILPFFLIAFFWGCTKDSVPDCQGISYRSEIKPIIDTYCVPCHTTGFVMGDFTTYEGLKPKIDNGRFQLLVFQNKVMPPSGNPAPTDEDMAKLKCWVSAGALNN